MTSEVELTTALAVTDEHVYIAGRPVSMPPYAPFTRLFHHHAEGPRPWTKHDVAWCATALARYDERPDAPPILCALSEEGDVELAAGRDRVVEKIPGAGLDGPTSTGHGYVASIRQIGRHLHVCGDGGQVHRRLGADRWTRMDEGLLQERGAPDRLLLSAIDGPAEDDVYVGGETTGREARLFHWDGARWSPIVLPPLGAILAIHVEDEHRVWLAGARGTLLVGSHRAGFTSLSTHRSPQVFHDVTVYGGTLYLGSSHGLFRYDEPRGRVVRARTDLAHELAEVHTVDHAGGVLWCVGARDIASFDGKTWTRIDHPDTPGVGG